MYLTVQAKLKKFTFYFLCVCSLTAIPRSWAEAPPSKIIIHIGDVDPFGGLLGKKLASAIKEQKAAFDEKNIVFEIKENSEATDVLKTLQDPKTIGMVWIGHPSLLLTGENSETILNSFLKTASKKYLPKNLLSAANSSLRFFGLITCHNKDVITRYPTPSELKIFMPENVKFSYDNNPRFELTHILTAPKDLIVKFKDQMAEWYKEPITLAPRPAKASLKINFRDLKSNHYGYEVMLNQKLIGVFYLQKDELDIIENYGSITIPVPDHLLIDGTNTLVVRADDALHPERKGYIDDILVDSVELINDTKTTTKLLNEIVHIGDDTSNIDKKTHLYFFKNLKDFEKHKPISELMITFTHQRLP